MHVVKVFFVVMLIMLCIPRTVHADNDLFKRQITMYNIEGSMIL